MDTCSVTAVIPAYNEAERIAGTVRDVQPHVDTALVIDDGSTDATAERARRAGARVVQQPTNRGYIAAIKRGFREAETPVVVTMDGDGELPSERIPDLVGPVCQGEADMVQGRRASIPRPSEAVLTWLAGWGGDVGDSGTGMRALRTDLARSLSLDGACICGIFALEVLNRSGTITEVSINLRDVNKPRGVAWYHFWQFFHILNILRRQVQDNPH
jgi:glycosyltransferase involved in cell wall biosynthesis